MPTSHAVCSASSSNRWLHCTRAPRFEEQFPASTSVYAEEGTVAHAVCEVAVRRKFMHLSDEAYDKAQETLKQNNLFQPEMLKTADVYVQYLWEKSMTFESAPYVRTEIRVDFSDYVPEGFGTCDCVMIGDDTLCITDYKHGKGVAVSAQGNSQMRLYALGALKRFSPIFGDRIKRVNMAICQPRLSEDVEEECITVDELLAWGESIKPKAQMAYMGLGEFNPGTWCRFCRGRSQCRARAEENLKAETIKDLSVIPGKPNPEQLPVLSDAEIGELLQRAAELAAWYSDLKEYVLQAVLEGKEIPGWKAVAGYGKRVFSDTDKAFSAIKKAGWDDAMLYERKPKTLAQLEKMIGKAEFNRIAGEYVLKPPGEPTLVVSSDKREAIKSVKDELRGVNG